MSRNIRHKITQKSSCALIIELLKKSKIVLIILYLTAKQFFKIETKSHSRKMSLKNLSNSTCISIF